MRRWLLPLLLLAAGPALAQSSSTITWGTTFQTMDGFGGQDWQTTLNSSQADAFFSPSAGIGLQFIRTGNTACPSTGTCSVVTGNVPDLTTLQEAVARGAKIELSIQSPSASLKYSGTFQSGTAGASGACLATTNFSAYATFMVQWIQLLNSNSAPVSYLDVANEANQDVSSNLGACVWSAATLDTFIGMYLGPAMSSAGLSGVQIMLPSSSSWFGTTVDLSTTCLNDATCAQYVTIASAHGYGSGAYYNTGYCCSSVSNPGSPTTNKKVWQSEVNGGFSYNSGAGLWNWDASMTDALVAAQMVNDYLVTANVSGWEWWQLADCCDGPYNDGLMQADLATTSKRMFVVGNWSKFIRSGWIRMAATNPTSGVYVTAFRTGAGTGWSAVAVNQNGGSSAVTFTLSGFGAVAAVTPWLTNASNNLASQSNVTVSGGTFTFTLPANSVVTFVPAGAPPATTYYIAANGSDSNDGLSTGHPWAHAPGMPMCASSCAAVTPMAGYNFIFRGGDTWHEGNSGASPYTGGTWTMAGSGSSGNLIYYGVDHTWFSGSSWSRPILTGDNPLTPHPGVWGDSVSSCPYQAGSNDNMVAGGGQDYYQLDNFEMLGLCLKTATPGPVTDMYVEFGPPHGIMSNLYIHGWTHIPYSCSIVGGEPSGICFGGYAFYGGTSMTFDHVVVDGSDSDPGGFGQFFNAPSVIQDSVFRYAATGSTPLCHVVANTLWEYIYSPDDNVAHGDTLLCIAEQSGINAYYNFIMRNSYPTGGTQPGFWIGPTTASTDYVFNILQYNNLGNQPFNIQTGESGNFGLTYVFNNTLQSGSGEAVLSCGFSNLVYSINNHFITDNGNPYYDPGTCSATTNLLMTNAAATAAGYTQAETYAYSPPMLSSPTVGMGANRTSICTTLLGNADPLVQAAGTACSADTTYACLYNTGNHTVSCPARGTVNRPGGSGKWDIGAYQYNGSSPTPPPPPRPLPPTGLVGVPF